MKENVLNVEDFSQIITKHIESIEYPSSPHTLFDPVNYILNIGGKRLRPILLLLSQQLYDSHYEKAIPAALAIEIFHNFTLVHDDIMDNADLRRNSHTVHKKWNINTGILSGDAMLIMAFQQIAKLDKQYFADVHKIFNQTALEVCEGQQYDMDFEKNHGVSVEHYLLMIKLKTSVLIAAALKMGGIIGGAKPDDQELLYKLGLNLGLGFQLQDDYLDAFSNAEEFGKETGGDIVQNKKTFMLISALSKANDEEKKELIGWLEKKEFDRNEKVTAVKNIFKKLEIDTITKDICELYFRNAHDCLLDVDAPNIKKQKIFELIEILRVRQK